MPAGASISAWEFYRPFLLANQLGTVIPTSDAPIAAFNCPSSDLPLLVPNDEQVDKRAARGLATTTYKGSKGAGDRGVLVRPDLAASGTFETIKLQDGQAPDPLRIENPGRFFYRFKDITDGLSNTIAAGESAYAIEWNSSGKQRWPIWIGTPGDDWDEVVLYKTEFTVNCEFRSAKAFWEYDDAPVQVSRAKLTGYNDRRNATDVNDCAYGWHPGGVMIVFCDGSVHFLSEDLDHRTHVYLSDPVDDQVIQGLDL